MPKVSFVLFPEFQMLAYVLATETLRLANKCAGKDLFQWSTRSATNAPVQASNGALVAPDCLDWVGPSRADLIVLCAGYHPLAFLTPRVRAFVARAAREAVVIGAVDTGTVILAELGLLDGRRAVLHFEATAAFRDRWPDIEVTDQIYCLDGQRLTAAGGTATGDAMLAWIERDIDPQLANVVADGMIHGRPRRGDTPQRSETTADPRLLRMHQMMVSNLPNPLPIATISQSLDLSSKQMRRLCVAAYGVTPAAYYRNCRLEQAHQLLVNSQLAITDVALHCGFESASSFSRAVLDRFGKSPRAIRAERRFGQADAPR
ncbi:GlxA family transcriptional regulator [Loktanella sp. IMCC34160]|uniref:GlxA family transcriptional regulator n=1 Tax=Loktanella sp. IMCC34160 TaxID=2510646 RepID=UPI00101BD96B|nr:GlxA family transcriptional regulator [Loktanella sp. IMCC34160]RYG90321.1 GlxA family transcriptional regulator [Loktanella sp. IMCC34160]